VLRNVGSDVIRIHQVEASKVDLGGDTGIRTISDLAVVNLTGRAVTL
jgi:hypothetical protein